MTAATSRRTGATRPRTTLNQPTGKESSGTSQDRDAVGQGYARRWSWIGRNRVLPGWRPCPTRPRQFPPKQGRPTRVQSAGGAQFRHTQRIQCRDPPENRREGPATPVYTEARRREWTSQGCDTSRDPFHPEVLWTMHLKSSLTGSSGPTSRVIFPARHETSAQDKCGHMRLQNGASEANP
jgi:hypothetical protein